MSVTNDVLTVFRANTDQQKAAVKSLRGVERERAKEVLDGLNKENAALEASIAKWTKIGIAVGAAVGAYALLKKAHSAYLEDVRLESAAAGVNVEKLKAATRGLVEEDHLLAFAGKAQAGVWKLNQQEMERVLKGAMALRKTMGVELEPTVQALTESITKGSTRALKEFGIEAKDKSEALSELDKIVDKVGGNFDMAGDSIQRSGVKAADAIDNLMGALGRLIEKLAPAFEHLTEFVDWVADKFGDNTPGRYQGPGGNDRKLAEDYLYELRSDPNNGFLQSRYEKHRKAYFDALAADVMEKTAQAGAEASAAYDADIANRQKEFAEYSKFVRAREGRLGRGGRAGAGGGAPGGTQSFYGDYTAGGFGPEFSGLGGAGITAGGIDSATGIEAIPEAGAQKDLAKQMAKGRKMLADADAEKNRRNLFQAVFGTPDEISATATALGLAHTAVEGLSGAIASSFEAWVTGAESSGEVFKRVVAGFVHSMGVELAQVGAKHLILAAVDAATLNFPGAAMHGAAAGIALGGSAVMFKIASGMGYGKAAPAGVGTGASGGAGYAVGGGYGGAGGKSTGDQTTIIYLAPDWSDETPTQRKQKLARAVREGSVARTSNVVLHR